VTVTDANRSSHVRAALSAVRRSFVTVGLFSGVINLLALTSPLYMLQVYDRVLASRSVPTLVALSLAALWMFAVQGILDVIRARMLVRIGAGIDETLGERVFRAVVSLPLKDRRVRGDGLQPLRDLDAIRGFLSSGGPVAILDLPWLPIYLAVVFLLHPWLGWLSTGGALVLCFLTFLTDRLSRIPAKEAVRESGLRMAAAEAGRRNAEVLRAMGLTDAMTDRFMRANERFLDHSERMSDVAGLLGGLTKVLRLALQSAVLGLGAYLVIRQDMSAGAILAASVIMSRALAPVETAIAHWKGFVAARDGARRLDTVLAAFGEEEDPLALPPPRLHLSVENVHVAPPGLRMPVVFDVSFKLRAGEALGIIGPSAAGKSTLVRAITGVWPCLRGEVRLDGAALDRRSAADLGRHIGYLPQDIELFDGTVAENIARFDPDATPDPVIAAARAAGVHEMILHLPEGYETRLGEAGTALSAGQRQRIGLARALYRDPFLVVLDEPNSNLDAEGEAALTEAVRGVRRRGGVAVVIAHRASAVSAVDLLAVLNGGRLQAFGPKEEVLRGVMKPQPASPDEPARLDAERRRAVAGRQAPPRSAGEPT
jgi:ATP-binding cassette subfamily C protein